MIHLSFKSGRPGRGGGQVRTPSPPGSLGSKACKPSSRPDVSILLPGLRHRQNVDSDGLRRVRGISRWLPATPPVARDIAPRASLFRPPPLSAPIGPFLGPSLALVWPLHENRAKLLPASAYSPAGRTYCCSQAVPRASCLAVLTIAWMPAFTAAGRLGHARVRSAKPGSLGPQSPPSAPDSAPPVFKTGCLSGVFEECSSPVSPSNWSRRWIPFRHRDRH